MKERDKKKAKKKNNKNKSTRQVGHYVQLSVSQGKRSCEGWWVRRTGVKGRRSSWSGGSEETLLLSSPSSSSLSRFSLVFSSDDLDPLLVPKPMQNPRSLLDNLGVLSRNVNGFGASPRLKASSMLEGEQKREE